MRIAVDERTVRAGRVVLIEPPLTKDEERLRALWDYYRVLLALDERKDMRQ